MQIFTHHVVFEISQFSLVFVMADLRSDWFPIVSKLILYAQNRCARGDIVPLRKLPTPSTVPNPIYIDKTRVEPWNIRYSAKTLKTTVWQKNVRFSIIILWL